MITKYGYETVGVMVLICAAFIIAGIFVQNLYLRIFLFGFAGLLLIFTLNFFRDPERTPPAETDVIVSPADGKVLLIKDVEENVFIQGKAKQVSVFMSPLNVHVNRIPISGSVEFLQYIAGEYLVAFDDKADEKNERMLTGIVSPHGKVLYSQIAGFVARRIVNELTLHQKVTIGERFGMIKFGSRVDVWVSADWEVCVKPGDLVTAGETVLFRVKEER